VQTNTDNSGFNFITDYPKADFICLDEPEARLATCNKYGSLENIIGNLSAFLKCNKIIITHGQDDTTAYDGTFYHIPIFSKDVKDTTGAGDAFFSIASLCAKTTPMDLVGFIGNAVGALKVRTVCNRSSVEPKELYKFITALLK
jgi:sugar/nucleoside kinase (ribokinase family)